MFVERLRRTASGGRIESTSTSIGGKGDMPTKARDHVPPAYANGTRPVGPISTGPTSTSKAPARHWDMQKLRPLRKAPLIVFPEPEGPSALRLTGRWDKDKPIDPGPTASLVPSVPKVVRFRGVRTSASDRQKFAAMAERRQELRAKRALLGSADAAAAAAPAAAMLAAAPAKSAASAA